MFVEMNHVLVAPESQSDTNGFVAHFNSCECHSGLFYLLTRLLRASLKSHSNRKTKPNKTLYFGTIQSSSRPFRPL